jgi:hypothetical protein
MDVPEEIKKYIASQPEKKTQRDASVAPHHSASNAGM